MPRIIICPECGKEKPHHAKGLCQACYRRGKYREKRAPILHSGGNEPYDQLVTAWNKWLGRSIIKEAPHLFPSEKEERRIAIISDTHCPFEDRAVIAALVREAPYDIIVLAGDVLDFLAVSPFVHDKTSSMTEEVQHGTWVLEVLAGAAGVLYVVGGNHGRRILKLLDNAHLPTDLLALLKWFQPQLDLFKLMASGLTNVEVVGDKDEDNAVSASFLVQVGDAIIGHPDLSRKVKLRAVGAFAEWLEDWKVPLGLSPFRVVAQGHTHQLGMVYTAGGGRLLIETGAAVTLEGVEYALRGKTYWAPPVAGFVTLTQYQKGGCWETEFSSVQLHFCKT